MRITARIAAEVAWHEGIVREAYRDSVGTWTWSVGLTSASGHSVERYIGNPQALDHCLEVYLWALERYAVAVRERFAGRELTETEFGAALSFHWNTGAIGSATWPDLFMAGDMEAARASFLQWRRPPAIIPRRKAEVALLFDGQWSGDGTMVEYTRLTAGGTPDWSSARRIEIRDTLRHLLGDTAGPPATEVPDQGIWAALVSAILTIFGGTK